MQVVWKQVYRTRSCLEYVYTMIKFDVFSTYFCHGALNFIMTLKNFQMILQVKNKSNFKII